MATKKEAELEKALAAAEARCDELTEQRNEAQDSLAMLETGVEKLKASHVDALAEQEADITRMRSEITALKLRPEPVAAPAPPAPTPLGSLHSPSGLIVVMDAEVLESEWKGKTNAQQGYVVDIVGPHAEYLASRQSFQRAPIPGLPGGMRITTTNTIEAHATLEDARRVIVTEGWNDTVEAYSLGATYTLALDTARSHGGIGMASKAALALAVKAVPKGGTVSLSVLNGKIVVG